MIITVYHTSPQPLVLSAEGAWLFFALQPYYMTAVAHPVVYALDLDTAAVIDARRLFYHSDAQRLRPLVRRMSREYGVSEDVAERLIEESISSYDVFDDPERAAEAGWDAQRLAGEGAEVLGYRGVRLHDEQGVVFLLRVFTDDVYLPSFS